MSVCERVRGLVGHFSNRIRKERYLHSPVTCVIYILRGNQARDFSVCVVTLVACVCSPASQVHTHTASLSEQLHVQRRYTPFLRHLVHRGVPQPIWCMRAARWRGGDRGAHPMSRQLDKLDSPYYAAPWAGDVPTAPAESEKARVQAPMQVSRRKLTGSKSALHAA